MICQQASARNALKKFLVLKTLQKVNNNKYLHYKLYIIMWLCEVIPAPKRCLRNLCPRVADKKKYQGINVYYIVHGRYSKTK